MLVNKKILRVFFIANNPGTDNFSEYVLGFNIVATNVSNGDGIDIWLNSNATISGTKSQSQVGRITIVK